MIDRILVVDDEESIRALLVDSLRYEGYECEAFESVNKALAEIASSEYSLVITDIIMPERTGLELLHELRLKYPDTFVIVLSGVVDTETAMRCIHMGATDYIIKPFTNERLSVTVRNALRQRKLFLEHREYELGLEIRVREQTEQIKEALLETARITQEMEIARTIQEALIPQYFPRTDRLDFAATYRPAGFVGGDYYDYFHRGDGLLDMVIADVSGHNVGSALIVAEIRGALQGQHAVSLSNCAETLSFLNEALYDDLCRVGLLVSMFYFRFDENKSMLYYANAGHNRQLLLRNNGHVEELDGEGMIIGVSPQRSFEEKSLRFAPGDRFLLFTDGITEAENDKGELFGVERLESALYESREKDSLGALAYIISSVENFTADVPFRDDLAMVLVTVR